MTSKDNAGVKVPPPFIYVVFFLAAVAAQRAVPLPLLPPVTRSIGILLMAVWFVLMVWSFGLFRASHTSIVPVRPTTALVFSGPYRRTRNPMYLSLLFLYCGLALWMRLLWPLFLLPVLVWTVSATVIAREERYLASKFGASYLDYQRQVRRWI